VVRGFQLLAQGMPVTRDAISEIPLTVSHVRIPLLVVAAASKLPSGLNATARTPPKVSVKIDRVRSA
jgi:hypothetical protein